MHITALVSLSLLAMLCKASASTAQLQNERVNASWNLHDNMLWPGTLADRQTQQKLDVKGELFCLVLSDGSFVHAADFHLAGPVQTLPLPVNPAASRLSERLPGQQLVAELVSVDGNLRVTWRAVLRDGSRYVRQVLAFSAVKTAVPLNGILLLDTPLVNAKPTGSVEGSPVALEGAFFGVEHPLSINRGEMGFVRCFLPRGTVLPAGESYECSLVIGFVDKGQLRRDFLTYLERERAHPYRPFLHYNSWYDIGYFSKFDEHAALHVINTFGEELVHKRGVKLDSFLFDDGWDDYSTLWKFDRTNFPSGFAPLQKAAAAIGSAPGIWLSPWGGYGKPHDERIKFGKEQGFEIRDNNFSMAGPKYYARFRQLCVDVVQKYGINQFKFDGIGQNTGEGGGGAMRDFDAMLKLIAELRALKPDIYINLTTGTWPSPFWLLYADSIWRGGEDHDFLSGTAPERERWISYKDNDVHERIVGKSDLFPLNSLMIHGIIFAKGAHGLNHDTNSVLKSEIRAYFGNGTQLQELYITPALMKPADWDALAEAATWSRANADTLVDTHWIGGSPEERAIYGWASWSPRKGLVTLRNPRAQAATIKLDAAKIFELPANAAKNYQLVSPFKDQVLPVEQLRAGEEIAFKLKPFEVLVVEALPVAP